jgi:A/G-specific adenine glycosylase
VLLSETMLQQTQVATVVPYFLRFIERFPTIADLASGELQEILRLWQGLGYYRRARNLHACVQRVVSEHGGRVPGDVATLLTLPGVGRYTAGAIASLAYGTRAPILDGNVTRVLCRLDAIDTDPRARDTQALLWRRAEAILPDRKVGAFNSALMELGATLCTPRNPKCLVCPVQEQSDAARQGRQEEIPLPKKAKAVPLHRRYVLCIGQGQRFWIEQRPRTGRWAGLWQFKTLESGSKPFSQKQLRSKFNLEVSKPQPLGVVRHRLTHRQYEFDVYACDWLGDRRSDATWVSLEELDDYPLPKPHVEVAQLLRAHDWPRPAGYCKSGA